jgi:hypothetical protein
MGDLPSEEFFTVVKNAEIFQSGEKCEDAKISQNGEKREDFSK